VIHEDVVISDPQGVHALVAQNLATRARDFASSLFLRHQGRTASLDDPIAVLALGLGPGASVGIWADGDDETLALATISAMLGTTEPDARADREPSSRPGEPT
jgi:phosphocarrier protein HPr